MRGKNKTNKAPIFGISRLRIGTDGHGVTTLVTFMGCPLHCRYCLNERCHEPIFEANGKTPRKGILLLTPQELYDRVKIDNIYFQATGGGICFGGGEPTMQVDFIEEFARLCRHRWKITLETSLYRCSYADMMRLAPFVDEWIVDIKDLNSYVYKEYTQSSSHILQSLSCLKKLGLVSKTTIKVPHIPDFNTAADVAESIMELREHGFDHIKEIQYYLPANLQTT